jgi:hypothetical protein
MPKHQFRLVAVAAALTALFVAVSPSFAAPKPHNSSSSTPALTGVVSDGTYTVSGSGFQPGETVVLNVGEAGGCCNAMNVFADASGAFTYSGPAAAPGAYTVRAAESLRSKWTFVAEWDFAV